MKILNKLTLKNLRLNKSRTVVTVIGIILSAALITVVAGMALSLQETMIDAEINSSGNYEITLNGSNLNSEDIKAINANRNVENVYVSQHVGCGYIEESKNSKRPYLAVMAYSEDALKDCFRLALKEGQYPKNRNELVLSQDFLNNTGKKYSVGDKITVGLGTRYWAEKDYEIAFNEPYGQIYYKGNTTDIKETLKTNETVTYTVSGIAEDNLSANLSDLNCPCAYVYTCLEDNNTIGNSTVFVDIKPEAEKDYLDVAGQILGISREQVKKFTDVSASDEEMKEIKAKIKFDDFSTNNSVLKMKGYALGDNTMATIYTLAAVIILIVIITSVFVIRNSFAISITEKTKLYGMMASVGATKKQIRRNVLFEGFILGILGIPMGLLLGAGVIVALTAILNLLLKESLNGISFVYIIPVVPMIFAVILSGIVILLSSLSSAIRASKIPPVDAIRSNNDVKIKNRKYRSPKFIKKVFGIGGAIAYKNLKRSKRKYRTTVISIAVSVALFISMSAFLDYGLGYTDDFYGEMPYNLTVYLGTFQGKGYDAMKSEAEKISRLNGINSYYTCAWDSMILDVSADKIAVSKDSSYFQDKIFKENNGLYTDVTVEAVNDKMFREIVRSLGLDYENTKDKAILYNRFRSFDENNRRTYLNLFKDISGDTVEFQKSDDTYGYSQPIKIAKVINKKNELIETVTTSGFIVNESWAKDNMSQYSSYSMMINTDDADKVEQEINALELDGIDIYNADKMARQTNAIMLVFQIFVYGFIAVISLIGITNIFNTITTNMRLRSKEFAMLKSVGMTRREFNRMIRLESIFYGTKSLLWGIPLGILGTYGIFYGFSQSLVFDFIIPWKAILISIAFVFIVVWLIMKFSISKVRKQNIIETIRNDNV